MTESPPLGGSVDVHAHVLDPRRPRHPGAAYELFPASPADFRRHLGELGMECGVLVTASAHGTDNQPMLDALAGDPDRLRGIAVVEADVTDRELLALHESGVRGVRLQDLFPGGAPLSGLVEMGARVRDMGWHIEIWTDFARHVADLPRQIAACPVPVVLDHFGYLPATIAPDHPAVGAMIGLARDHGTWITLSGAYRLAPELAPQQAGEAVRERVEVLLEAVPDQLLWASDWPYVAAPREAPDAAGQVRERDRWLADPALRQQVLVTNPRRCYGFGSV